MSLKLLIGLAIVCGTRPAGAERAISVDVTVAAPFHAGELRDAMRMRLPHEGAPVHVRVTATPIGIQVEARGYVREVDVAGLSGAAAARLVALAANDLLLEDLATLPLTPPALAARTTVSPPATTAAFGGVAGWERMLGGFALDLALPRGRGLVAVDLGAATIVGGPLHLTAGIARLSGGARFGVVELRAGITLVPVFVSDGAGDSTLLAGAGASVRVRLPVSPRLHAVFALGADAFATRTEYRVDGMSVMTTPQLAPWLAAGMEVTP